MTLSDTISDLTSRGFLIQTIGQRNYKTQPHSWVAAIAKPDPNGNYRVRNHLGDIVPLSGLAYAKTPEEALVRAEAAWEEAVVKAAQDASTPKFVPRNPPVQQSLDDLLSGF